MRALGLGPGEEVEFNGGDKGRRAVDGFLHKLSALGGKDKSEDEAVNPKPQTGTSDQKQEKSATSEVKQ